MVMASRRVIHIESDLNAYGTHCNRFSDQIGWPKSNTIHRLMRYGLRVKPSNKAHTVKTPTESRGGKKQIEYIEDHRFIKLEWCLDQLSSERYNLIHEKYCTRSRNGKKLKDKDRWKRLYPALTDAEAKNKFYYMLETTHKTLDDLYDLYEQDRNLIEG